MTPRRQTVEQFLGEGDPQVVPPPPAPRIPDPVFVLEAGKKFAARVKDEITPEWLAARSPVRPDNRTPASFLHALYRPGEKVVVFDDYESQGQELWEHPGFPFDARALARFAKGAPAGVWFLTAPVDGEYRRSAQGKRTRRSEACVTAWRYLVVESDRSELTVQDWLRVLVRLPLCIVAVYETGGNLPHALVELPAASKEEWDAKRDQLKPSLVTLGADPSTMTAVRLSRLPQCERLGKYDREGKYRAYAEPRVQRLLYLNPPADYLPGYLEPWADETPIIEKPVVNEAK